MVDYDHHCPSSIIFFSGFKFWKVGSRKIFAIPQDRNPSYKQVDSDEDFEPAKKRRRSEGNTSFANIASDIRDIRKDLQSIFNISKSAQLE